MDTGPLHYPLLPLTAFTDYGTGLLLLSLVIAAIWSLVAWRREVRLRSIIQGLAIALVAGAGGRLMLENGLVSETAFWLLLVLAPLMYVAGGLLIDRTGLGEIQLLAGRYAKALWSLFTGALLFVPLGLMNATTGSPGMDITWVTEWWMVPSLPLFSGITEETLYRLMLVGLCYALLRPVLPKSPVPAIIAAILFSGITFGLGHGRTLEVFLTTGLLYGVPLAATFVRRDWEHTVGAHYIINMIPWTMVFLSA